jgi:hypothetical protein
MKTGTFAGTRCLWIWGPATIDFGLAGKEGFELAGGPNNIKAFITAVGQGPASGSELVAGLGVQATHFRSHRLCAVSGGYADN